MLYFKETLFKKHLNIIQHYELHTLTNIKGPL